MSIYIADFKPAGGGFTCVHDDAPGGPHGGTLATTDITFGVQPDGSPDFKTAIINCPFPGCGSASYHPIGGGAAPRSVQEMMIRMMIRLGCPCGALIPGRAPTLVITHARNHVNQLEGVGRWQVASIVP